MIIQDKDDFPFSNVSVIGLGYIGLPTAAVLAARKIPVIGVDINEVAVNTINAGAIHFKEPELDIIVHAAVSEGYLRATLKPEPADVFLIAVPTPFKDEYQPDLSYVKAASESIAEVLKVGDLVILESTSPVGTTEKMADWLAAMRPDLNFPQTHGELADVKIAYCPERVLPGYILHELVHNDRIIGGMTNESSFLAMKLYKSFVSGECIITNTRTAEMSKLTENSFRDVNIAFANELSIICDKLDINVWDLIQLANKHPRVNILKPGVGVGGHCIPVDPWFIVSNFPEDAKLIRAARLVNDNKRMWVVNKVQSLIENLLQKNPNKSAKDITIACFGMTFKPDVDDMRESPALAIIKNLASMHSGPLYVVEPNITELPLELKKAVELRQLQESFKEADIILKLVNHTAFKKLFTELKDSDGVIDFCGTDQPQRN